MDQAQLEKDYDIEEWKALSNEERYEITGYRYANNKVLASLEHQQRGFIIEFIKTADIEVIPGAQVIRDVFMLEMIAQPCIDNPFMNCSNHNAAKTVARYARSYGMK